MSKSVISENIIIQEDLEFSANCQYFDLGKLRNQTVLITGITGFIGRQIVLTLLCMNELHNANIKIVGMARNEQKVKSIFKDFYQNDNISFIIQDITTEINTKQDIDYIIHCANPVNSKVFVEQPVETIDAIVTGTYNILKLAKEKKVKSLVYLSSMEVYGIIDLPSIKENDYGYVDPLNVRSSYPVGKMLAENMCVSYFREYGVPTKIIRLSQVFGAGLDYDDSRVLSQFIRSILEDKDIILHTEGKSILTNCYISDTINGIFTVLLKGTNGECYNLANSKNVFSIKEVAQLLVNKSKKSKLSFDIKDIGKYRPDTVLKLNTEKINELGWVAQINLEEMLDRTIKSFKYGRSYSE